MSKFFPVLKRVLLVLVALTILGGLIGVSVIAYYSQGLPDPNKLIDRQVVESTKIYDRTGQQLLYEIHDSINRTIIKIDDIPDYAKNAIVALEDKNFYTHRGLSFKRIVLAVALRLLNKNGPGASTLTQQLVKNAILTPDKVISRKLKEWVLTLEIEKNFNKNQILQLYLNEIPFGATAYGIEAASNLYFDKSAKNLSLAESAVLAAIIKKPTYYSPYGPHKDELIGRQHLALDLMAEQGFISKDQAATAKDDKLLFRAKTETITAPHFVFYIKEQLSNNYGEKILEQGGLRVYTTLDYDLQKTAEKAVEDGVDKNKKFGASNASMVAVNPKNGEILAMVGSKDYFDIDNDGNVNVSISLRQPGSSFKPVVYAAAFIKGYTPETILYDVVTTFKTDTPKDYTPHNYDNKEHGPVTMRQALAGSLNTPAVKTIYLTGVDRVISLAKDLGYTSFEDRSRFGLSLVLGGAEVKLLEHAMAFSAFANDGAKNTGPVSILKIQDKDGNILEEARYTSKQVLSKDVAHQISSILSDNNARAYIFSLKNSLTLKDRPVAAKTGTTNDFRDAWTLGYTPQLVAGVWVGNNDNSKMKTGADGSVLAAPIWNRFMTEALKGKPAIAFPAPPVNITKKPVLRGEQVGEKTLRIDRASGLLATDFTPASFVETQTYAENHNILYYIDKDAPDGEIPTDPTVDPQYQNWEDAVQLWAAEQNKDKPVVSKTPPTSYDNLHVPENRPTVNLLSPIDNQMVSKNVLSAAISTSAPRGVARAQYFLDDVLMAEVRSAPFNLESLSITNLANGFHDLKVRVFDDIDNSAEAKIVFNLLSDKPSVLISWVSPVNFSTLSSASFPLPLKITVNRPTNVKDVAFYFANSAGERREIYRLTQGITATPATNWSVPPAPGKYTIMAVVTTTDGLSIESDPLSVVMN